MVPLEGEAPFAGASHAHLVACTKKGHCWNGPLVFSVGGVKGDWGTSHLAPRLILMDNLSPDLS